MHQLWVVNRESVMEKRVKAQRHNTRRARNTNTITKSTTTEERGKRKRLGARRNIEVTGLQGMVMHRAPAGLQLRLLENMMRFELQK